MDISEDSDIACGIGMIPQRAWDIYRGSNFGTSVSGTDEMCKGFGEVREKGDQEYLLSSCRYSKGFKIKRDVGPSIYPASRAYQGHIRERRSGPPSG